MAAINTSHSEPIDSATACKVLGIDNKKFPSVPMKKLIERGIVKRYYKLGKLWRFDLDEITQIREKAFKGEIKL